MTWILWVIVGLMALNIVTRICFVGQEQKPTTPGLVAASTVVNALVIWAIIAIGIYG